VLRYYWLANRENILSVKKHPALLIAKHSLLEVEEKTEEAPANPSWPGKTAVEC